MKIRIIAVGQKMPAWVLSAYQDYAKRIQPMLSVELVELPLAKRRKNQHSPADIAKYRTAEGAKIHAAKKPSERLVCLDVRGSAVSTETLAKQLEGWMLQGQDIALVIGGPDGLSDEVLRAAEWRWSLSQLTLPHPLVRVVLIEQLYRAMSMNRGHPYHRA